MPGKPCQGLVTDFALWIQENSSLFEVHKIPSDSAPFRSRLPNLTDKIVGNLGVSSLWSDHVERKVKHRNLLVLRCALSLSSVQLFATPQTVA